MSVESSDVVIVGGGPGGLAVSQQLTERRISNVILERGDHAGWMWGHVYDSLRLHTGKHLSSLPGMPFPAGTSLFPTRSEFTSYLESYVDRFQLPIRTGVEATGLRRENGGWTVETSVWRVPVQGRRGCNGNHVLTGGARLPRGVLLYRANVPQHGVQAARRAHGAIDIGGRDWELCGGDSLRTRQRRDGSCVVRAVGRERHPKKHRRHSVPILGLVDVLASGTHAEADCTWERPYRQSSEAQPSRFAEEGGFGGCQDVPVIGRAIVDHIDAGRVRLMPGIAEFSENGVRFTDGTEWVGDTVMLATGYRAAIEWMGDYDARDGCGFARRLDRVRSADHPDLYFVGHNYDGRGGLYNIRIDAKRIARLVAHSHSQ